MSTNRCPARRFARPFPLLASTLLIVVGFAPPAHAGPAGLPDTGANVGWILWGVVLLLAVGGLLMVLRSRGGGGGGSTAAMGDGGADAGAGGGGD